MYLLKWSDRINLPHSLKKFKRAVRVFEKTYNRRRARFRVSKNSCEEIKNFKKSRSPKEIFPSRRNGTRRKWFRNTYLILYVSVGSNPLINTRAIGVCTLCVIIYIYVCVIEDPLGRPWNSSNQIRRIDADDNDRFTSWGTCRAGLAWCVECSPIVPSSPQGRD